LDAGEITSCHRPDCSILFSILFSSSYRKTVLFGTVFNFLLNFEPWFDQLLFETFKAVEICKDQTKQNLER
jgi:hypothetical protein